MIRRAILAMAALLIAAPIPGAGADVRRSTAMRVEPGFVVTPYAVTGGAPTSLAFGPDTRDKKATRLYVADFVGNQILAIDDLAGIGSQPEVFAEGFSAPLGVLAARDGTVFVADAEPARKGPFGFRPYGRVWRVVDTDKDGVANKKTVVLKDLPNGRHNTNGMAIGPDGMLYVTNGNSTDDGSEGGEAEVKPWSGSVIKVPLNSKNRSAADLPRSALVAQGWRNVYDLAFSPVDRTKLFIPMNGLDDARKGSTGENPADPNLADSDDLLFMTDINDRRVDDFGFPQCLYNVAEKGSLKPYTNPNPDTVEVFGKCKTKSVPRPVASFGLHVSADGLAFQKTKAWGAKYTNDVFVAEWGSLFGMPTGHKVVRVELNKAGTRVVDQHDFLEMDLPIDVTFDKAGAMYVADFSGAIVKVVSAT
jgi:glucose/arabinose dehydrogenase